MQKVSEKDLAERIDTYLSEDAEKNGGMFLSRDELLLCKIALEANSAVTQDMQARKKLTQKEKADLYDALRAQFVKLSVQYKESAADEYMHIGNMGALSRADAVKYGRMKAYQEIEKDIKESLRMIT